MHEQRIRRADEGEVLEPHRRPLPRLPGLRRERMRRRGDPENVEDHQFAVVLPPRRQESRFRLPSHRQQRRVAVSHPLEIDAAIRGVGRACERRVVLEALTGGEDAGHQQRCVNRRKLAVPYAHARLRVDEVREPAVLVGSLRSRNKIVVRARPAAVPLGSQPRSAAMQRLARPKPVAAMLATSRWFSSCGDPSVRARSRTWPVAGSACSSK